MKKILVHFEKCTGCKSCELACAVEHSVSKNLMQAIFEPRPPRHRIYVEAVGSKPVPVHCHHCEEAPCEKACISGAIRTEMQRGAVVLLGQKCIGCWSCVMVCPVGVIGRQHNGHSVAFKCDRCPDRDTPACVAGCPTHALEFVEVESFTRQRRQSAAVSATGGELCAT